MALKSSRLDIKTATTRCYALARWLVYAENITTRNAFYEAGSDGVHAWIRYGKIGSAGTTRQKTPHDALVGICKKVNGGEYIVKLDRGKAVAAYGAVPRLKPTRRVPTLRDKIGQTTMRPTTLHGWWGMVATHSLRRMPDDASQYLDIFQGAMAVVLWADQKSALWVVVRNNDESVTFGKIAR